MRPLTVDKNDRLGAQKSKRKPVKKNTIRKRLSTSKRQISKRSNKPKIELRLGKGSLLFAVTSLFGTTKNATQKLRRKRTAGSSARRKPAPVWRKPAIICGCTLVGAIAIAGLSNFLSERDVVQASSDWIDEQQFALARAFGLTVQEISVVGREKTSPKDLLKALDVARGDSILDVDPEHARERIETLGWVESASVMRRYPDEIYIKIDERRPFARWQIDGRTGLIDRNGAVVTSNDTPEFRYLPKVVGSGANEHAAELFDMLAQNPTLFTRLRNAVRVRDRRWNLEFDNDVTVLLPEENALEAWKQLAAMQDKKKLLDKGLVAIDLRAADRVYVRLKSDAAALRRANGEKT
ncbi:FtsQ-type POTRA domain-containing protein [Sneathiella marina]|uniref:Cell division protein FtsQ n=1 Tax=Sneathiella marina TaxID=2950108 RepID=A0ABY4W2Q8_9PROT|nr:FtsQ-type POTRA domain-containing protein [Sneathiella marina]USG60398.1 FtsQ-type POTRA domain-containing protein [Sneathiella marina]